MGWDNENKIAILDEHIKSFDSSDSFETQISKPFLRKVDGILSVLLCLALAAFAWCIISMLFLLDIKRHMFEESLFNKNSISTCVYVRARAEFLYVSLKLMLDLKDEKL